MMAVSLGNHMAAFAAQADRSKIRAFYCGVLGCEARVQSDDVDRLQLGDTHFCFVYQPEGLAPDDFLKATYLELKSDDPDGLRRKIEAFGVRTLDAPDPHLYFQAPGGQVFRIVGENEDLSAYEDSASTRPVSISEVQ